MEQKDEMKHRRVYAMLRLAGHSPESALRVVVDARRGEEFALSWIRMIRRIITGWSSDKSKLAAERKV